jgi:hypothetical protein
MDMLEYMLNKNTLLLTALCEKQLIDPSTIPGFNSPPPIHSNSLAASSPGLGVALLALSDTHSNTSSRSSRKSGRSGKTIVIN